MEHLQSFEIPLTQGQTAIVDAEDSDLARHKWSASRIRNTFYAVRQVRKGLFIGRESLHRVIAERMGFEIKGKEIDHKNGNGLDNRRANLRVATASQNQMNRVTRGSNTSGFRGVHPSGKKWAAHIKSNGKQIYISTHEHPEDAARAYDAKAKELFGEYANLNFP